MNNLQIISNPRFGKLSKADRNELLKAYSNKELLFVGIDLQNGFMKPIEVNPKTGKRINLPVPQAATILGPVARMTQLVRSLKAPYLQTLDTHFKNDREHKDFKAITDEHCIKGTKGHSLIPEAVLNSFSAVVSWLPYKKDVPSTEQIKAFAQNCIPVQMEKRDYISFLNTPKAQEFLKNAEAKTAVLFGVTTDFCVAAALRGLLEAGYKVFAVTDAMKEIKQKPQDIPLFQNTRFTTTRELYNIFEKAL